LLQNQKNSNTLTRTLHRTLES